MKEDQKEEGDMFCCACALMWEAREEEDGFLMG